MLADDHPFYREGLARLLEQSGIDVVAVVGNGDAAIRAVADAAPDVVVMDLNMPGMSGLEATRILSQRSPASRVLVLSVSAQAEDVTEAVLSGACGYVLKEAPVEEVVAGIRAAADGQSLISPRIASVLLRRVREAAADEATDLRAVLLSPREYEVLGLLAQGRPNHDIAAELVISPSTVHKHVSSILLKLQVENRVQAAVRAVRDGLV